MPKRGDVVADKYRIERQIGVGGMGAVFEATHLVMESPVAVKWLIPTQGHHGEARERFIREARAAARIRHPNVVQVFDVGEEDGALYMVMELLDGEPFDALIVRGDLPIPDALGLLVHALWGVNAAHQRGVIHRDIKPENIFVVNDPTQPNGLCAKVLDFGISKVSEDDRANTGLTKSGVTMGTPAYMSPEQIHDPRDVDARADVYGFGVLMYRALTGRLPFAGESFGAIAVAASTRTPEPPKALRPELSTTLSDIVMRAMARDREDRYPSAQELLEALTTLSTTQGYLRQVTEPSSMPPALAPRSGIALKQGRGAYAGAAVATASAAPVLLAAVSLVLVSTVLALTLWTPGKTEEVGAGEGAEAARETATAASAYEASSVESPDDSPRAVIPEGDVTALQDREGDKLPLGLSPEEAEDLLDGVTGRAGNGTRTAPVRSQRDTAPVPNKGTARGRPGRPGADRRNRIQHRSGGVGFDEL